MTAQRVSAGMICARGSGKGDCLYERRRCSDETIGFSAPSGAPERGGREGVRKCGMVEARSCRADL
jgi:hypothetical protein